MPPADRYASDPHAAASVVGRARIILSAFGLHYGGGAVLIREIVSILGAKIGFATLDWRIVDELQPHLPRVEAVPSQLLPRLRALVEVAREAGPEDCLFCLNSLPPLARSRAHTIVYVHSPQFAGLMDGITFPPQERARHWMDRLLFRAGRRNVDEIWVQTESIAAAMRRFAGPIPMRVIPFVDAAALAAGAPRADRLSAPLRFFYPADASAHKNHLRLFAAWRLLRAELPDVQLVVTLEPAPFDRIVQEAGVTDLAGHGIVNAGRLARADVLRLLDDASALIFPSLVETFGIPLVEARARGVPILASERDFVRDVCEPAETFDPLSARSIARAVRRYLGRASPPPLPVTGAEIARRLEASA
jgi:glycosyltransferase involved in cell wall biosynthesis